MNLPARRAIEAALYQKSYYDFFKRAYAVLHPGGPYSDNFHIRRLCDVMQAEVERIVAGRIREQDLIINTPFRSAKSLIFSVCLQAWVWTWQPGFKFICVSYGADLALELAHKCRQLIQSEWYASTFPAVQLAPDNNQKGFFETTAGGYRKSLGAGGQITGGGADLIILDDPQDPKRANSEVERKTTIAFYDGTLYSRVNNLSVGSRVIVQQRLHEEDLSGYLLATDPDGHRHINIPAELVGTARVLPVDWEEDYVDGLFWPDRFTRAELARYLKRLGPKQYANQLQQQPAPDEGLVFQKAWFPITRVRPTGTVNFWLDTASTEDEKNDATAVIAAIKHGEAWTIVHAETVRKEMPELVEWVQNLAVKYGSPASRFHIENKSSGLALIQLLRKRTRLHVTPLEPGKLSKRERADMATPTCADGRVELLAAAWNDSFLQEVGAYPTAKHDDLVDALSYMVNTPTSTGLSYAF